MEKSDHVVVVPFGSAWSDLGCWASRIWKINYVDDNQNVVIGDVM